MVHGGDDPTLRNLRSGFGKQVVSPASTLPAWGFGTSSRDAAGKVRTTASSTALHAAPVCCIKLRLP